MAWRSPGNKPLSEPMMFSLLMHICITRPQWVKDSLGKDNTFTFPANLTLQGCVQFSFAEQWRTQELDICTRCIRSQNNRETGLGSIQFQVYQNLLQWALFLNMEIQKQQIFMCRCYSLLPHIYNSLKNKNKWNKAWNRIHDYLSIDEPCCNVCYVRLTRLMIIHPGQDLSKTAQNTEMVLFGF